MNKSSRLVFFGNERIVSGLPETPATTLKTLIANGYQIAAVVSSYTEAQSRNARPLEVAEVAKTHNIPLLLPKKLKDIKDDFKTIGAEAAVLVAYGRIIPKEIIEIFPKGIINIHPSLLPIYRGPTPIEQAILDGVKDTGVSLMQLTEKMDEGPVYAQAKVSLSGNENKFDLALNLLKIGSEMLIKHLPQILDGSIKPVPQNNAQAVYTKLLDKNAGIIKWDKPATVYEREVRAYAGYPKSKAKIEDVDVIITKAKVATRPFDHKGIIRHCANDTVLEIEELIAPSGRTMNGADFLRGYAFRTEPK